MKDTPKILSVQDISCYGQCSNTVLLPILSAAGLETVVLPTALLSTHTGGFQGYTFLDLTEEMEKILTHFSSLSLRFDYLCTGYLGSAGQIDLLLSYLPQLLAPGALRVVDPVMGDEGKLYSIYGPDYVQHMRLLCGMADIITPNITEACLLADLPYSGPQNGVDFYQTLFTRLHALGVPRVLVTGVIFDEKTIGAIGHTVEGEQFSVPSPYVKRHLHGTGDVLAGSLIGFLARGLTFEAAAHRAVAFVSDCIADTLPVIDQHWYGLRFEGRLGELCNP